MCPYHSVAWSRSAWRTLEDTVAQDMKWTATFTFIFWELWSTEQQLLFSWTQVRHFWSCLWLAWHMKWNLKPMSGMNVCAVASDASPIRAHFLWCSPTFFNWFNLKTLHWLLLFLVNAALCEEPARLTVTFCGLPSSWRKVWVTVFWRIVKSFP